MIDRAQLDRWMQGREDEHCEFKKAENQVDSDELTDYCLALANEGGGNYILGVTNKMPRKVVGSRACQDLGGTKHQLLQRIHLRVEAAEIDYDGKRVVVFRVPPRPVGTPLQYKGRYLMRCGESLTPMTPERLQVIFAEAQPDFSALTRPGATTDDLAPAAIDRFRTLWHRKSRSLDISRLPVSRVLADAELIDAQGGVTHAALILLGKPKALSRHLAQAEIVFEYRNSQSSIPYQQRREFRQGYLLFDDELWNTINLRNEVQPVREGMFIGQVKAFNEEVVREALLNAVCHRDYHLGEAVFVRQSPSKLEIESPGGLPGGITPETIIQRQYRRNRLLAEALQKCGLIERSSQGVDKMFRLMILESKLRPDYSGSDANRVVLRLFSEVQDPEFLSFLAKATKRPKGDFDLTDLLLLDDVRQGKVQTATEDVRRLVAEGLIERIGHGRGTRYILAKKFYTTAGLKAAYTREKGLDRETNKALILTHLDNHEGRGTIQELEAVLKDLRRSQIHGLLQELRDEGKVQFVGNKRSGYWQKVGGWRGYPFG
jgi:ATP-dependent DNA helicase RecG